MAKFKTKRKIPPTSNEIKIEASKWGPNKIPDDYKYSKNYHESKKLLYELHELMAEGYSETEEADLVREDMYDLYYKCTEKENKSLENLSVELYKDPRYKHYLEYEKLQHQLFKIRDENNGEDSEEEDRLLEKMDSVWNYLTEQERRSINQFSEDLWKDFK